MTTDLILVSGASGFLASHIVKQLLEQGYRVRGTVRNLKDEKKVAPLRNLIENPKYPLELCEADLLDENSWINAVKDCTYIIHTASPVPNYVPDDEDECIKPAVNGVLSLFKACVIDNSTVKKVVLTSSIVAISGDEYKHEFIYTESDWGDANIATPYTKSKILAEKAAWAFVEERKLANLPVFQLVTINPGLIIGPILHGCFCTSMDLFKKLLEREMPIIPDISIPLADVRDVALAHIKAMVSHEAVSKRYIVTSLNVSLTLKSCALILYEEFRPKGYYVPTLCAPSFLLRIYAYFDQTAKLVVPFLGKTLYFNNDRFIKELGIKPIDCKKSMLDMAYDIIEKGYVTKRF